MARDASLFSTGASTSVSARSTKEETRPVSLVCISPFFWPKVLEDTVGLDPSAAVDVHVSMFTLCCSLSVSPGSSIFGSSQIRFRKVSTCTGGIVEAIPSRK